MSTVILDTITGKSTATTITIGSTPVVSASANSMTIRGEGTAQTSIQQGLCKSWINFDGTGTIAISDSHNVTSITDDGTALYTVTIANDMANTTYALTVIGDDSGSRANTFGYAEAYAVGSFQIRLQDDQSSSIDTDIVGCTVHGDLA